MKKIELCGSVVSWQGMKASSQKLCEGAILEADSQTPVKLSHNYSTDQHFTYNHMRNSDPEPPS